jgi:hypothetical protein
MRSPTHTHIRALGTATQTQRGQGTPYIRKYYNKKYKI